MTPKQVLTLIGREKIEFVDLRFMDFPGSWQHKIYTAGEITEKTFSDGVGFDGSCVRGWEAVNEGDMLLVPVPTTARIDPFCQRPTLSMICDVKDPVTKKQFSRDPRSVARKAERYMLDSGVADKALFSPELEFFVFDRVRYEQSINHAVYEVDSAEGEWARGQDDPMNLGHQLRRNQGLFPSPPMDSLSELRAEMVSVLQQMGVRVESHHHEVSTGGQCEIDLKALPLVQMADAAMIYKYVVKQVAARHGKSATFMPKPLHGDNGSGMHTHLSLFKGTKNIMAGRHYAGLSQIGLHAIAGILAHAPAIIALSNPTTNSFRRLIPGYEAPTQLTYSSRNRWAAIRIPTYSADPNDRGIEIRFPDGSANPYLAFAALLMAALDGIERKLQPDDPVDIDIAELPARQRRKIAGAPHDLSAALDALETDHDFLLAGDVFSKDLITHWIGYKRETEIEPLHQRPHPFEFCMYYDC